MYFYHSVPANAPDFASDERKALWPTLYATLDSRMKRLDEALTLVGCRGEDFAACAQSIYRRDADLTKLPNGDILLDTLTPAQIAEQVKSLLLAFVGQPDRMEWPNTDVLVDTAFVATQEWELLRTISIGGSDAAVILGVSPYRTPYALYHDKLGTPCDTTVLEDQAGKAFIFEYGHRIEGLVVSEFCRRTGATIIPETRMFRSKKYPSLTANVDAIVRMPNGEIWLFEAKTTTGWNREAWDGCCPPQYVPQCRHYAGVMADERIMGEWLCCIYGNTPDCYAAVELPRDTFTEEIQMEDVNDFFADHIAKQVAPAITAGVTPKLYYGYHKMPEDNGTYVVLPDSELSLVEEYQKAVKLRKEYKDREEAMKAQSEALALELVALLGEAPKGYIPLANGKCVEIRHATRKSTVANTEYIEQLAVTHPEIAANLKITKESPTVPSIKEKRIPKGIKLS